MIYSVQAPPETSRGASGNCDARYGQRESGPRRTRFLISGKQLRLRTFAVGLSLCCGKLGFRLDRRHCEELGDSYVLKLQRSNVRMLEEGPLYRRCNLQDFW